MTDTYEPHEREAGHDETLNPQPGEVPEAPSDYEFADEHSATAEHSEEQDSVATVASAKGRSPLLPVAAAVVGVVLLGGVAWWQFGGSGAGDSNTYMPPPASVPAMPAMTNAAPMPAPQPVAPTVDAPQPTAAPVAAVVPAATPVAAPMPTPPVATAVATTAGADATQDHRIDALAAHLDQLQKSLDQVTQQLGQISTAVANTNGGTAPSTKDLQDKVDALEQQIAQLRHTAPTLTPPAVVDNQGDVAAPAPAPVKTVTHHVKTVKAAAHKTAHVAAAKKEKAAPAATWVLRAAVPGQAWVATSATSTDLKQVHVGDTLEGVGRISSINQQDGNWVVVGSKGTLQ